LPPLTEIERVMDLAESAVETNPPPPPEEPAASAEQAEPQADANGQIFGA
jgi:hypothetical protein